MTLPARVTAALLIVAPFVGYVVGAVRAERRAAFEWTYNGVTFEAKGDRK